MTSELEENVATGDKAAGHCSASNKDQEYRKAVAMKKMHRELALDPNPTMKGESVSREPRGAMLGFVGQGTCCGEFQASIVLSISERRESDWGDHWPVE